MNQCRICLEDNDELIKPCKCNGTIAYVHKACLETWINASGSNHCEICNDVYLPPYDTPVPIEAGDEHVEDCFDELLKDLQKILIVNMLCIVLIASERFKDVPPTTPAIILLTGLMIINTWIVVRFIKFVVMFCT